jgi:hypothetical protein
VRCGEQRQDLALIGRHAERIGSADGESPPAGASAP